MKRIALGLAATMALFAAVPASAATEVFRENFEGTNQGTNLGQFRPQGNVAIVSGQQYINLGPTPGSVFTGDAAAAANRYASFGSGNNNPSAGSLLSASIAGASTIQSYTLSFAAGVIGAAGNQYLSVAVNNAGANNTGFTRVLTLTGSNNLNQALTNYSFTFNATGPFSFDFFGGGVPGDGADTLLDNVTVTANAVPEMATWGMMIVGFGAIGGTVRSRRRREKKAGGTAFAAA